MTVLKLAVLCFDIHKQNFKTLFTHHCILISHQKKSIAYEAQTTGKNPEDQQENNDFLKCWHFSHPGSVVPTGEVLDMTLFILNLKSVVISMTLQKLEPRAIYFHGPNSSDIKKYFSRKSFLQT